MSSTSFRNTVWRYYRAHGRHDLSWRATRDPYKILVSEVMLQQTQVDRVIPFYKNFLKRYPTAKKLAAAPLADVLSAWSGLGYNRRAKLLREAAQNLSKWSYRTKKIDIDTVVRAFEDLPGVGPYTARAVAAFAYNADVVFVETNIRTAIIHHFFSQRAKLGSRNTTIYSSKVSDKEIERTLGKVLPKGKAREWYSALMDYGAHLKRSGVKLNAQSRHYAKQSKFEGSLRQVRGAILKTLTTGEPLTEAVLRRRLENHRGDAFMVVPALAGLERDRLIKRKGRRWCIA